MSQQHPDIDSLIDRADRMLDGMAVNRELFVRDVKRMTAELAQWRNAHARLQPKRPPEQTQRAREPDPTSGDFSTAFGDLFKGFGGYDPRK